MAGTHILMQLRILESSFVADKLNKINPNAQPLVNLSSYTTNLFYAFFLPMLVSRLPMNQAVTKMLMTPAMMVTGFLRPDSRV